MSIAETYRAMSDDIERAAMGADDEDVRRAYLALAELWRKRARGFPGSADENLARSVKDHRTVAPEF